MTAKAVQFKNKGNEIYVFTREQQRNIYRVKIQSEACPKQAKIRKNL